MKKSISVAILTLSLALTGCGSADSSESDSAATSEATSASPAPDIDTTDATAICAEVSKKSGALLQKALENIEDPGKAAKIYGQIAKAYEAGAEKVDGSEAKDAFRAMADANRDIAKTGPSAADSDQLNEANDQFGKACFGG